MEETLGQQLKRLRQERNLTIAKVVQATRIRAHYITAMEADDLEALPSPVQARAFVRLYAEYLGLPLDELNDRKKEKTEDLEDASEEYLPPPPEPEPLEPESVPEPELPQPVPDGTPARSQEIFSTIGETLRHRREGLSLTLDEIERHTHVRRHYLEALEAGDIQRLPSSVQARGMLSNYAHFLNLDIDAILLQFAEGLQARLLERQAAAAGPAPVEETRTRAASTFNSNLLSTLKRYISIDVLVGGGLIVLLIILAVWGTSRVIALNSSRTPQPTAPSISDMLLASTVVGQPTGTTSPDNGQQAGLPIGEVTLVSTLPESGGGPVSVVVIALQEAWVRVIVDFKVAYEGRVAAGTAYPYDGNVQIEVLTGDGSAIRILYNQSDLGQMGGFGEVVDRIYTLNAILLPTATFTPSPTITQTPTITPKPSNTPIPSRTPRASSTPRFTETPSP